MLLLFLNKLTKSYLDLQQRAWYCIANKLVKILVYNKCNIKIKGECYDN